MIITFSKNYAASPSHNPLVSNVLETVENIGLQHYRLPLAVIVKHGWNGGPFGNLFAGITWTNGRRVRFTIQTRDPDAKGSRRSAGGRRMRKASWEAHRDVMRALLKADKDATIRTGFATYRGLVNFEETHAATAHRNVGSQADPVTIRECSVL